MARQPSLADVWQGQAPPVYNGGGGSTHEDHVIGSRTASVGNQKITYVAIRTWIVNDGSEGWGVAIRRYDFDTGACIENPNCSESFFFPTAPTATNYFYPTAMTEYQKPGAADEDHTYVLVTGYSKAPTYGNTDFRTVCWNSTLVPRWDVTTSLFLPARPTITGPDEYPVDIDAEGGLVVVTGNTHNRTDWDIHTVIHRFNDGHVLHAATEGAPGGGDEFAAGCRTFGFLGASSWSYVVGTENAGQMGNSVVACRYEADLMGGWTVQKRSYQASPGSLPSFRINAMDACHGDGRGFAVAAGRVAGIDASEMLLVKLDFNPGAAGWGVSYSAIQPAINTQNEAFTVRCLPTIGFASPDVGDLYAIGGHGLRTGGYGIDSLMCLYEEAVPDQAPTLPWSAWLNRDDSAIDVADRCTDIEIDATASGANEPDGYRVYVIGQRPITLTDLDWRVAVYTSQPTAPSTNPALKGISGNTLEFGGTAAGADAPVHLNLIEVVGTHHHVIVTGNVYNGPFSGLDALTRRLRYQE